MLRPDTGIHCEHTQPPVEEEEQSFNVAYDIIFPECELHRHIRLRHLVIDWMVRRVNFIVLALGLKFQHAQPRVGLATFILLPLLSARSRKVSVLNVTFTARIANGIVFMVIVAQCVVPRKWKERVVAFVSHGARELETHGALQVVLCEFQSLQILSFQNYRE